jgi:hypothetical protein
VKLQIRYATGRKTFPGEAVNTEISPLRFHGKPGQVASVEMTKERAMVP